MGAEARVRQTGYAKAHKLAYLDLGGNAAALMKTGIRSDNVLMAFVRSPLAAIIALFVGAVAARLTAHASAGTGILLLLIVPIVLTTLAYRPLLGLAVSAASLTAFVLCQAIDGGVDPVGVGTRGFTYFAIPVTIWLARKDAERRRAAAPGEAAEQPRRRRAETGAEALTQREREVLALVAAGHTSAQIAAMLVLSVRTIESHRAAVRRKLGRPSAPELARHAQLWGILPADRGIAPTDAVARA
jgi:DNA-binding CsgD family transcriptional regulator